MLTTRPPRGLNKRDTQPDRTHAEAKERTFAWHPARVCRRSDARARALFSFTRSRAFHRALLVVRTGFRHAAADRNAAVSRHVPDLRARPSAHRRRAAAQVFAHARRRRA